MNPELKGPVEPIILEQYKQYVEMADRISQRRAVANNFFLTLNTALIGLSASLSGLSQTASVPGGAALAVSVFGLPLAWSWETILTSYRQINGAKFSIIHELEISLPAAPYTREWDLVGHGGDPQKYRPLSHVESWVPRLFMMAYAALAGWAIWQIV